MESPRGEARRRADRVSLPAGVTNPRRVGGGDINEAWRVTLVGGGEAFVKTRPDARPGEYATEAQGLKWLAAPGAVRTPRVLEVAYDYLVLEWVPQGSLSAAGAEELGRGLALTHAAGAPAFSAAGGGAAGFGCCLAAAMPVPPNGWRAATRVSPHIAASRHPHLRLRRSVPAGGVGRSTETCAPTPTASASVCICWRGCW